jgi:hypothetical protein
MNKKHNYCIFSMCSKNYRDAYDFVIDTWLKTDVDKIIIYTDDKDWKSDNPRIDIVKIFEPSTDWLVNTGRRSIASQHVLDNYDYDKLIFLDIDCYVIKDISHVFDSDFDIAVVRWTKDPSVQISAGVFFINKNSKTKSFGNDWTKWSEKVKKEKRGLKAHAGSYAQIGYGKLIKTNAKNKIYKVKKLEFNEYSIKVKNLKQIRKLNKNIEHFEEYLKKWDIKVLHYYSNSYRDEETVKWCMNIINKNQKNLL